MPEDATVPPTKEADPPPAAAADAGSAERPNRKAATKVNIENVASTVITLSFGAVVLISSFGGWELMATYWRYTVAGVGVALLVPLFLLIRYWVKRASPTQRAGMIIFVAVPLSITAFFAVLPFVAPGYQVVILRSVFLALVILIPPALYYLFIATRRETLLNAYLSNLHRLGLLWPRPLNPALAGETFESEGSRSRRVRSYFERFEAVYGRLPETFVDDLVASTSLLAPNGGPSGKTVHLSWAISFALQTIMPVVAATILIALGWILVLPLRLQGSSPTDQPDLSSAFLPEMTVVNFAFLGAYFFSLQMLVRRFVRRDLGPNAFVAISLRIVLATIGVWVAAHVLPFFAAVSVSDDTKLTIAFAIGAFPLIVWQLIAGMFKQLPFITFALPSLKTALPLSELDGLSVWHEARLEEEDIENIPNMATADIVDLMLNTRFPPHRIVDWVDQSILYTAANADGDKENGARRRLLQQAGIRTASALVEAVRAGTGKIDGVGVAAGSTKPAEETNKVRALADALATSPNLELVLTWKGLPPIARKERPPAAAVG